MRTYVNVFARKVHDVCGQGYWMDVTKQFWDGFQVACF
jgi:hypothetical protein